MINLIHSFSKSYSIDKQKEFIKILKKLKPYLIFQNKSGVNLNTGVSFRVLPTELIWEILLYLKPSELTKFYKAEKDKYKQIFINQTFWKQKFYFDFVSPKKYGENGYVYPTFIERLFEPTNWKESHTYFYEKIKQFNYLNSYLLKGERVEYDAGFIIKHLKDIFEKGVFSFDWSAEGRLGNTINNMIQVLFSERYKFRIKYEDKLFLVNIIKIIIKERKKLKVLGVESYKGGFRLYLSPIKSENLLISYMVMNFDDKLKNDKDIFLMVLKINSILFRYSGEKLRRDKNMALIAVKENGSLLEYLPYYQNDFEVVLIAVSNDGDSIQYAKEWLKDNRDIALAAVKNNEKSLFFVSNRLQKDKNFVEEAIKLDRKALFYTSQRLKDKYKYKS